MAPNDSRQLAPYDYKHTLLLFSSSMTPTDFHLLLPPRELTPQPYSQRAVYTSPIKALSNQKYAEFKSWFS